MDQNRYNGQEMRLEQKNQIRPNTYVAPKERRNIPMNMNRGFNSSPQMRNSNPPAIQRRSPMNNSQRMNSGSSNMRSSGMQRNSGSGRR